MSERPGVVLRWYANGSTSIGINFDTMWMRRQILVAAKLLQMLPKVARNMERVFREARIREAVIMRH